MTGLALLLVAAVVAQHERELDAYRVERRALGIELGGQHLELALDARKKGLYPQAAWELRRCLAVSHDATPGAALCRKLMQERHEDWWMKKPRSKPPSSAVHAYSRKASRLGEEDRESRLKLAVDAARSGLGDAVIADLREVIVEVGEPLEMKSGKLRVLGQRVPAEVSERIWSEAQDIDGRRYVKDAFLEALAPTTPLYEASDEALCVRSQRGTNEALAFHRLGRALFPFLEEEMAAQANRRLHLFLFSDRALYEKYLADTKQSRYGEVSGFTDVQRGTAIVVLDDFLDPDDATALVLHELTHLFMYEVAPTPMPSWYSEGLAELYSAPGTFTWDGETLTVGGRLPAEAIHELARSETRRGIFGMFETSALEVWSTGGDAVRAYYTEAWALLTFLREGAGKKVALDLLEWELTCRGGGLVAARHGEGAKPADTQPAQLLFLSFYENGELRRLEDEFAAWLSAYE